MDKPLTVKIEELKRNLVNDVNNSGLHIYIAHSILKDLCDEMHILLTNLTQKETEEYNKQVESEKQASDSNDGESKN